MKKPLPSIEDIRHFFSIREDGALVWKAKPSKRILAGRVAGTPVNGYTVVIFRRKHIGAHRIIWALCNGYWPKDDIDHINMIRTDNRIENLREATRSQNKYNTRMQRDNTSGFKGVDLDKRRGKWRARISVDGQILDLGYFQTAEDGAAAYRAAAIQHHGEFARI